MPIERGDFILIDYVTRIKETGEVFDTTIAEEAKAGRIFKDNTVYEPMLIVVGEGWVLKGLDDSLVGLEVDKESIIELPPEQGFGLRDPSKISLLPIRRLTRKNITPYPGAQVEIDGKLAIVRSVGAGRVQLDFNPPLAGKTLTYTLTVKDLLKNRKRKIQALIHRRIPSVEVDSFKLRTTSARLTVNLPEAVFYLEGIQFAKRGIALDIQKFFPHIEKIVFSESFTRKSSDPSTSEASQKQADDSKGT